MIEPAGESERSNGISVVEKPDLFTSEIKKLQASNVTITNTTLAWNPVEWRAEKYPLIPARIEFAQSGMVKPTLLPDELPKTITNCLSRGVNSIQNHLQDTYTHQQEFAEQTEKQIHPRGRLEQFLRNIRKRKTRTEETRIQYEKREEREETASDTLRGYLSDTIGNPPNVQLLSAFIESNGTTVQIHHFYTGGLQREHEQITQIAKLYSWATQAARDTQKILPTADSTSHIVLYDFPQQQSHIEPDGTVTYTDVFAGIRSMVEAGGTTGSGGVNPDTTIVLFPDPKPQWNFVQRKQAIAGIETLTDLSAYLITRHEMVHEVHERIGGAADFTMEGLARMVESMDIASSRIHRSVHPKRINIDRIFRYMDIPPNAPWRADLRPTKEDLYGHSTSLFRFLYDTFGEKKFGQFITKISGKQAIQSQIALGDVYGLTVAEVGEQWKQTIQAAKS